MLTVHRGSDGSFPSARLSAGRGIGARSWQPPKRPGRRAGRSGRGEPQTPPEVTGGRRRDTDRPAMAANPGETSALICRRSAGSFFRFPAATSRYTQATLRRGNQELSLRQSFSRQVGRPMAKGIGVHGTTHVLRLKRAIEVGIADFVRTAPGGSRDRVAYAVSGGHRTRGVACLLACEAVGSPWRSAVPVGVAIELGHKSSVIRDDIADGDSLRRGRVTPHIKYGVPRALTTSDYLLASSFKQIAEFPSVGNDCLRLFVKTFHSMATGQLNDVEGGVLETPETGEWGSNHQLKTASLAVLPFETGAIVGGGSEHQREALVSFGTLVGLAFQLLNDVRALLNYERGKGNTSSDLRTGKATPLVSWAKHVASPQQSAEIDRLLQQSLPLTDDQVGRLRAILVDLGAHEYTQRQALLLLDKARGQIAGLDDSLAKRILYKGSMGTSFARLAF